ncbi:MAG: 50S ribosomal protein L27 [Candidatus Woesebacteria bacterium GW2011_GWB1_43_14]|uniref:Large ribosomal subunit protein bL27 n=2 Tax=Candidatus Woeseibacteriota TaxID=1752722 RepID=A0A1F7WS04_9BACT|nr:MAG: 50S ribosomal protein L27 [Candidatus Woesebacteria bacterium GW2011_GWB1_43_14]OGM04938.1 MAG: hypothetical protein A2112_01665 [Candidatus Woesebacteria bacterium GWA1_42_12]
MSTHKQGGKASQHVSPAGKRLEMKVSNGEEVGVGEILVRQRGTKFHAGVGAKKGRDHTIFSIRSGKVKVAQKYGKGIISIN